MGENYSTAAKSQKKEFYWDICGFGQGSSCMEYWSHFSVLNQDFRPVLPVKYGMPLSVIKIKEQSSFAQ